MKGAEGIKIFSRPATREVVTQVRPETFGTAVREIMDRLTLRPPQASPTSALSKPTLP